MENEYCPDCVIKLVLIHKKIDNNIRRKYLKCPRCGFIKRPKTIGETYKEIDLFREIHKLDKSVDNRVNINLNLNI